MNEGMGWRKCAHCGKDRYCTEQAMFEHQEDCPQRPSKRSSTRLCPKCGSMLTRFANPAGELWLCINADCDYELGVVTGRKIT